MKVIINLEFNSQEEAAAFLMGAPKTANATATVAKDVMVTPAPVAAPVQQAAPQQFQATVQPVAAGMTPIEKARATKAANAAKKAAEASVQTPATTVPTSAFPSAPQQPISPMPQMPAAPQGMPMPAGMPAAPAINYGAPAPMPAPQQTYQAQAPQPVAPVQQAAPQAWDKAAVVASVDAAAKGSGLQGTVIRQMFGEIFQENGITAMPLGQLNDQDLYKFQLAFYPKLQAYGGNTQNLI